MYRSIEGLVPDDYYQIELGKAYIVQQGSKATIVTYGAGVHWALQAAKDKDIEIIDLYTLLPRDEETVLASVQ